MNGASGDEVWARRCGALLALLSPEVREGAAVEIFDAYQAWVQATPRPRQWRVELLIDGMVRGRAVVAVAASTAEAAVAIARDLASMHDAWEPVGEKAVDWDETSIRTGSITQVSEEGPA